MNKNDDNNIVIIRYDSHIYGSLEAAKKAEQRFAKIVTIPEYNTIEKYGDGYVVTNRFDPRCNDQITPLTPGFTNYSISGR